MFDPIFRHQNFWLYNNIHQNCVLLLQFHKLNSSSLKKNKWKVPCCLLKDLLWVYPLEWIFFIRGILTWSPISSLQGSILYGGAYNRFLIISAISGVTLLGSIPIERFTVLLMFLVISCNTEYQSCVRFSVKYLSYLGLKSIANKILICTF